jgi:bifunctional ADP-heptose synthase (sugar kinase/adenylyltransferase)
LNQTEAETLIGSTDYSGTCVDVAGGRLAGELNVGTLVVTRGSRGLSLWHRNGEIKHISAHPVEVYDVAGAGDTVISALTLAAVSGALINEAAEIANHAAACVVRKLGVATVTTDELLADWVR